jgi:hypothetical protein
MMTRAESLVEAVEAGTPISSRKERAGAGIFAVVLRIFTPSELNL